MTTPKPISQMGRENMRRKWAKRSTITPHSNDKYNVFYTGKYGQILDAIVEQHQNGQFTCTCKIRTDPLRCRHIVAVEIHLGQYKNPYEGDFLKQQALLKEKSLKEKEKKHQKWLIKQAAKRAKQSVR